ncbi:RecB family exonuclease [Aldersonia sp. NBC_00410]|uniref:RecB family exonuclease n=1 Tax=Aldersonia sp. NBC_00410 TaxID=2975954 RepID=UPI0022526340|nr:RecB family exonuclease [Aldersonia sp. NBC_00410]MCX5045839.1 RecB family exonuclease [Aldersonia sp. NBC_00410]
MTLAAPGDLDLAGDNLEASSAGETAERSRLALSPSRAADFRQCPLKYRLRAIDRIPEAPSPAATRGNVVHAALEALYDLPAAQRSPDRASELVDPAWDRLVEERPGLDGAFDEPERTALLAGARSLVRGYFQLEDPSAFEPSACESRVEVELDDGVLLRGFIDRIDIAPDGALRVVDYKTGRVPAVMREQSALFQMKFYALIILRTRGVLAKQLRLLYLAGAEILTYGPDADELFRFERTLSAMWRAIRAAGATGDFRPNPSRLCSWCDYRAICPAFGGSVPAYPGWPDTEE